MNYSLAFLLVVATAILVASAPPTNTEGQSSEVQSAEQELDLEECVVPDCQPKITGNLRRQLERSENELAQLENNILDFQPLNAQWELITHYHNAVERAMEKLNAVKCDAEERIQFVYAAERNAEFRTQLQRADPELYAQLRDQGQRVAQLRGKWTRADNDFKQLGGNQLYKLIECIFWVRNALKRQAANNAGSNVGECFIWLHIAELHNAAECFAQLRDLEERAEEKLNALERVVPDVTVPSNNAANRAHLQRLFRARVELSAVIKARKAAKVKADEYANSQQQ